MTSSSDREITVSRTLHAPRELVFAAWTDPRHVVHWWGPNGFTNTIHEMDVRPGGIWRFVMHGPDGVDYPNRIVFREITVPERLVYDHGDDEAIHFQVTVRFIEDGGKTNLSICMLFPTAEACQKTRQFGAVEGGRQTLDRLAEYIARMEEAEA